MSEKQKAFEKWMCENPYRQYLEDPNCIHVTRASAAGYMDIGWRCGYSAGQRAEKRKQRSHDSQYKLEQINKMIDRQERAAKKRKVKS